VACSRPIRSDDGYATPAAIIVSLSLAIVATGVSDRSLAALELARSDFARTRAELALDGALQEAALKLANAPAAAPIRWSASAGRGQAQVLAEPDAPKLSLAAAAALDDATLARIGAGDAEAARSRLQALVDQHDDGGGLASVDGAARWRRCARSWIAADGTQTTLPSPGAPRPQIGAPGGGGRTGEVWRLRASIEDGWVDDRTVRFTGEIDHPARVIERRFFRTSEGSGACDLVSER